MTLPKYAYFKGEIVPYSEAKVGVLTHGFNYGTAVFAGVRAYWNEEQEQQFVFRVNDHFQRFLNSAKIMCMEFDHTPESLTQITLDLLRKEEYRRDIYIPHWHTKQMKSLGSSCMICKMRSRFQPCHLRATSPTIPMLMSQFHPGDAWMTTPSQPAEK